MEPTGKRVDFLKYACSALGVEAEFAKERAEEAARKQWRESFDVATAGPWPHCRCWPSIACPC